MVSSEGTGNNKRLLIGIFKNKQAAELAYSELLYSGYQKDEINVLMTDNTRDKYYPSGEKKPDVNLEHEAVKGAGKGAAVGGAVGGIAGALAAVGAVLLIPGAGMLAIGPLTAGLAGAATGGVTGSIIGALLGGDVPEDRIRLYELLLKNGAIMLCIHPHNEEEVEAFTRNWEKLGAEVRY
jgi:hypothetical protein